MLSVSQRERLKTLRDRDKALRQLLGSRQPHDDLQVLMALLQWMVDDWTLELHELEQEDRQ